MLQTVNQVESWSDFFSTCQAPGKSAHECGFLYPDYHSDLSEYILMRKVMVGLHNSALKQEVFCRSPAQRSKLTGQRAVAEADVAADDVTEEEEPLVAALHQPAHPAKFGHYNPPADIPPNMGAR
ncbi:hypothetical protein E2C01_053175 [Portunus trituberculatus]|uniref:Uncharacterized protein n=1 Tax=Portunus trituberculatus TaxID=210409 RepID=A0A5B7GFQ3_PORTR|nr:hypothetical protein [Portunus trituberculatus]